jgi:hypothetical protein
LAHTQVQLARGTSAQTLAYTGPAGEVTVDTDDWSLRVHDGVTPGGHPLRTIGTNLVYDQPTSGATLTAAAHQAAFLVDPAAPLAALTIVMPSSPNDGDGFLLMTTAPIAQVTVSPAAGQSVDGAPTGLAPNGSASWQYRAATATWYRSGAAGLALDAFAAATALTLRGAA